MKKGSMVLEYTIIMLILALAIIASQKYIVRAFSGRWRSVGDTFGYGRQFEEGNTTETVTNSVL